MSSKSFAKIDRLEISNSILDISSDHSFDHNLYSNKKHSRSPSNKRTRNQNQYRTEPHSLNYSIEFQKKVG
jgi:hypothetical protein